VSRQHANARHSSTPDGDRSDARRSTQRELVTMVAMMTLGATVRGVRAMATREGRGDASARAVAGQRRSGLGRAIRCAGATRASSPSSSWSATTDEDGVPGDVARRGAAIVARAMRNNAVVAAARAPRVMYISKLKDAPLRTKFLAASALAVLSYTCVAIASYELFAAIMPALTNNGMNAANWAVYKPWIVVCQLGWFAGKITAVRSGAAAVRKFCSVNVFPMAYLTYHCFSVGAWDAPVWALFTAAYAYFGYVEKK